MKTRIWSKPAINGTDDSELYFMIILITIKWFVIQHAVAKIGHVLFELTAISINLTASIYEVILNVIGPIFALNNKQVV